jgi:acetyl esterase/lipase
MMRIYHRLILALLTVLLSSQTIAEPMRLQDYLALAGPPPDARIAYGPAQSQFAELFQPAGAGPYPVVVLIHGGCWAHKYGGLTQVAAMGHTLANEGIAVWSIEYRGVDEDGGGFPGTYEDIAAALDKLKDQSSALDIDLTRLVAVGHSAGAQLAQWVAARQRISPASPLYAATPLPITAVIGLGTLPNLRDTRSIEHACGLDPIALTGTPQPGRQDVLADTSPAAMLPSEARTVLINGELDTVAPPDLAARYAALARRAGNDVQTIVIPDTSHYDEVSTSSPVWPVLHAEIRKALNIR